MHRVTAWLFPAFVLIGTCVLGLAGTAAASGRTTYMPETPVVDTISGGPWNTSQGDPSAGGEYPSSDLLPTFSFGGPITVTKTTNSANRPRSPRRSNPEGVGLEL